MLQLLRALLFPARVHPALADYQKEDLLRRIRGRARQRLDFTLSANGLDEIDCELVRDAFDHLAEERGTHDAMTAACNYAAELSKAPKYRGTGIPAGLPCACEEVTP